MTRGSWFGLATLCMVLMIAVQTACTSDLPRGLRGNVYHNQFFSDWRHGLEGLGLQRARDEDILWTDAPDLVGRRSIRIQVHRDENFANLINGSPRAEFSLPREVVLRQGREYLVRWRTFLPRDFMFDDKQLTIITQIHQGGRTGSPPFMLTLAGSDYTFSARGGANTEHGYGGRLCCADNDRGRWVDWLLQYSPDATGRGAITHVWKDGVSVFDAGGRPNAYPGDQGAYLKFGVYKPDWQKKPSDVPVIALYFGAISVDATNDIQ